MSQAAVFGVRRESLVPFFAPPLARRAPAPPFACARAVLACSLAALAAVATPPSMPQRTCESICRVVARFTVGAGLPWPGRRVKVSLASAKKVGREKIGLTPPPPASDPHTASSTPTTGQASSRARRVITPKVMADLGSVRDRTKVR